IESGCGTADGLGDRRQRHIEIVPLAKEPDGLLDRFPGNVERVFLLRAGHQCLPRCGRTAPGPDCSSKDQGIIVSEGTLLLSCWRTAVRSLLNAINFH